VTATPDENADTGNPLTAAMSALLGPSAGRDGNDRSKWGRRLATATMATHWANRGYKWAQGKRNETRYSVALHDSDSLYAPAQDWVLSRMPPAEQKALVARSDRRHEVSSSPGPAELELVEHTLQPGVLRQVMSFTVEGAADEGCTGSMLLRVTDEQIAGLEPGHQYRIVWYTLDSRRLAGMLIEAGADDEQVARALLALDAAALQTADDPDGDDAEEVEVNYWRPELVKTLVNHQQRCSDGGCHCGWGVLGASWAEHVADMYEQEARS
jgi:hypothetical protein